MLRKRDSELEREEKDAREKLARLQTLSSGVRGVGGKQVGVESGKV